GLLLGAELDPLEPALETQPVEAERYQVVDRRVDHEQHTAQQEPGEPVVVPEDGERPGREAAASVRRKPCGRPDEREKDSDGGDCLDRGHSVCCRYDTSPGSFMRTSCCATRSTTP